jgi:hypothetical protein
MYRVGDRVQIKSRAWYERSRSEWGTVTSEKTPHCGFIQSMRRWCGKQCRIRTVKSGGNRTYPYYELEEDDHYSWTDWMFEPVKPSNVKEVL